eukprot:TRINITY_DN7435_c0_g1_i1.p1 TRINITY_DN7435_c0_g1~~TRINITY_DN7435_c0_g1_i1.p1  ORF type:complete len:290 (+),score=32.19 TRINITY_DN7435_c0_g1_i1:670-1539(+)
MHYVLRLLILFSICFSLLLLVFYAPGDQPKTYYKGDAVPLQVARLDSAVTQLPLNFYSLPFCLPVAARAKRENLGEMFRGDRILDSVYAINALVDVPCRVVCSMAFPVEDLPSLDELISQKYQIHWILDNLPAMISEDPKPQFLAWPKYRQEGFPVGVRGVDIPELNLGNQNYLNNHLDLTLYYNEQTDGGIRITGFAVDPKSVAHDDFFEEKARICEHRDSHDRQNVTNLNVFTYSVNWVVGLFQIDFIPFHHALTLQMTNSQLHCVGITDGTPFCPFRVTKFIGSQS